MEKNEKLMKLYHAQVLELIASYEGKNLIGKIVKNRQDIKDAYKRKIEELLLKMISIDDNSPYIVELRQKLSNL